MAEFSFSFISAGQFCYICFSKDLQTMRVSYHVEHSITYFQEDPYIMLSPPSVCSPTKGTICQMVADFKLNGVNITEKKMNPNSTIYKCCSGFCVDLIKKFANCLSFDFALKQVRDGKWKLS